MSPRAFDSDEVERGQAGLVFTENGDCPRCAEVFDAQFRDDSIAVQDIVSAPTAALTCPSCGYPFTATMTGWTFFGEAG